MAGRSYRVAWGYCEENYEDFPTFDAALEFYQTVKRDPWSSGVYNLDRIDLGNPDGLTHDEGDRL